MTLAVLQLQDNLRFIPAAEFWLPVLTVIYQELQGTADAEKVVCILNIFGATCGFVCITNKNKV